MHVRNGHPVYQVMSFPLRARLVSLTEARQQPSRLLAAEGQVVPFAGREQQLAELMFWRDDPASGVSIGLVHGPGGQGKTRLAAQFAANCRHAGWTCWAARHFSDPTAEHVVAPGAPGMDMVLVVDYADRWPVDDLLLLLGNPLLRYPRRARVLLVARSASYWWSSVRHRVEASGHHAGATISLPPLADTTSERRAAFASARDAFAGILGVPASVASAPEMMEGDAFSLALTLHMAALVAVDASRRGTQAPSDPAALSAYLLDREHDFWHALHDHEQISVTPAIMGRTVYTATLTRQLRRELALTALERAGVTDAVTAASVLEDHAACYPPSGPGTEARLEPLYPDRLGEDFVALATPGHDYPSYQADTWAESAPARLLTPAEQDPPPYTRPAVTTLIETARRWPHIAERQLNPILRHQPALAIAAGGAALADLANLPGLDTEVLEAIESRLPARRHVDLDLGIAAVTAQLTAMRLARTTKADEQARLYHDLGKRFTNAALCHEALAATTKAVEIRQQLAAQNPAAHEPELAVSLSNLGKALSDLGRHDQAVAVTKRAVDAYRRLTRPNSAAHDVGLAMALSNLAAQLSVLGRPEEALAAIIEAAEIRQRLASSDPATHESDLALTVSNLSVILRSLGRREKALIASKHAVEIWSRLAADDPAAHTPDLARALGNLAADLEEAGRPEEAVTMTGQAADIYRRLTRSNRAAHEPGLALALSNLAAQLSVVGRFDDALAAVEESVEIRSRLAADNPAAYEPALASALDKHGVTLAAVGRLHDAAAAIEKAAQIRQKLAAQNSAAHEPDLAESLNNLGKVLADSGHSRQARAVARQAAHMYRRLAAINPAVHEPGLAMALANLGMITLSPRWPRQALAATKESVSIYRRLALADAPQELSLATALYGFAVVRAAARKELPAALNAITEAISILERLAEVRPSAGAATLLAAYTIATNILDQLGDRARAAAIRRLIKNASQSGRSFQRE